MCGENKKHAKFDRSGLSPNVASHVRRVLQMWIVCECVYMILNYIIREDWTSRLLEAVYNKRGRDRRCWPSNGHVQCTYPLVGGADTSQKQDTCRYTCDTCTRLCWAFTCTSASL